MFKKRSAPPTRSRKIHSALAVVGASALVFGAFVVPAQAAEPSIVADGTFEAGQTGWTAPFGGTLAPSSDAATGTGSLAISDRTGFQSGPATSVTGLLSTSGVYKVTAKVKFAAATNGRTTQNFNITLCTTSRSKCEKVAGGAAQLGSWLTITGDFTPTANNFDLVFIETPWTNEVSSFLLDDFSLTVVDPGTPAVVEPTAVANNLLPDSRFITGFTGWTVQKGGELALNTDASTGSHSLAVSARTATQSGPFADVDGKLETGATYRLKASLKYTEGAATQNFNFTFCPTNFNGCRDYGQSFTKGAWGTFQRDFTAESAHAAMKWFFVETPWGSTALDNFSIDDVSLVKIQDAPVAPANGSLEKVQTKPLTDHNPLVGHKFGADPHHLIYNDRLYIYSTNDTQQYEANTKDANGLPTQSNGYGAITTLNVMSTDDMVNWVDHGSVPIAKAGGAAPWANNSWAPAAIEKDGKVYLYFCDSGTGTAVVVGGSPLGPWTDPLGKKIIPDTVSNEYKQNGGFPAGMWLFDPEVFIDDDGQAYLYFGGNSVIGSGANQQGPQNPKSTRVVKLKDDMVTLDGDPVTIDGPGMFEASSMFKRGDTYYYSYSSNFSVTPGPGYPTTGAIAYMMTKNPMELPSSKYAGVAFVNQSQFFGAGNGGNNHSDMFNYKGESYFTYHAQTRGSAWAAALGTGAGATQGYRSVHIDKIEFNADGTIKPITGTRAGVDQVQNFNPFRTFEAETLAWQLGIKTTATTEPSVEFPEHNGGNSGNMVLSSLDDADFTGISQVDFGKGATSVTARVKPLVAGTTIEVRLDSETGTVVGEIPVDAPLGAWANLTVPVTGAEGVHDLFFVFVAAEENGSALLEVDSWAFAPAQVDPGNPGTNPGNPGTNPGGGTPGNVVSSGNSNSLAGTGADFGNAISFALAALVMLAAGLGVSATSRRRRRAS